MKFLKFILLLLSVYSTNCFSQDCSKFDRWDECRPRIKGYSTYLQPRSIAVGINDTLTFNIVFEGNRDYILSFCANRLYYPIHVRLMKLGTKEEIYDNAVDKYCESIGVGFYNTQGLIVEITLLADKLGNAKLKRNEIVCVGLNMNSKKIFKKIE
jgi:hypothetical protein